MRAAGVVKADIAPKGGSSPRDVAIGPQVDFFIFDGSPWTFDEDIVPPRAFSYPCGEDRSLPGCISVLEARLFFMFVFRLRERG